MKKYLILDCYVDEPACLGVPPFISPYPRYIYGALMCAGVNPGSISYLTIDSMREQNFTFTENYDQVFLTGGAVVPGKYLGAKIGTLAEINRIIRQNRKTPIAVGGLINRAVERDTGNVTVLKNDIEKYAFTLAAGEPADMQRTTEEIAQWSSAGAEVVKKHPWFPDIICEIETGRGCPREKHCSFCSEGLIDKIEFRRSREVLDEIDSLLKYGVTRFRIGRQPDIIQFGSRLKEFRNGFPQPEPSEVIELFSELKKRKDSGAIHVLNVDNANPGSIVNWPEHSARILEIIAAAVTPGDTLPFGVESFDLNVVKQNSLKVTPEEAVMAIRIVNDICGGRINGIPALLPGINLIHGLKGETMDTFRINYEYLARIAEEGLLVKRINIRKLHPYPDTPIYSEKLKISNGMTKRFEYYRDKIRDDIDNLMLRQVYPAGTILRENFILETRDGYSMGKQISSYSITVKMPGELKLRTFQDAIITGHRERSLSTLPVPFNINTAPAKSFELIPGIGRERASTIVLKRPFETREALRDFLDNTPPQLAEAIIKNSRVETVQ
ncbi:MAG TPA: radical SAM protein [Spirochaetota bacterium]|nr:radical SAM protein [Spirochaetota bacterium]HPR37200.1 radical SAM protein [Spirochaetota bacterium]